MNKVLLVGNLVADPEMRMTQSGISCASFRIAVQRRYANQQGEYEADFISCVAWRQTAEHIGKYFRKGGKIGLVGSLQTRSYDAQDGTKRYVTEVLVDETEFVTPKANSQGGGSYAEQGQRGGSSQPPQQLQPQQQQMGFTQVEDDELPF